MNGFEYAAAIHMIMVGLVDEGMRCVEAICHRYDGERRNPWNEFECGNNYARSMASYALRPAFFGFQFDMAKGLIGFNPVQVPEEEFRCFWSLEAGWGQFRMTPGKCTLQVLYGNLPLQILQLPFLADRTLDRVTRDEEPVAHERTDNSVIFLGGIEIQAEQELFLSFHTQTDALPGD